jgi:orotate phosphoribosyltransferase
MSRSNLSSTLSIGKSDVRLTPVVWKSLRHSSSNSAWTIKNYTEIGHHMSRSTHVFISPYSVPKLAIPMTFAEKLDAGSYVQASGAVFPYYIDLRRIISDPQLFHQVLSAYAIVTAPLQFDRIAGIPYGSLPTATGLSLKLNRPMIYPRKEVKAHGTRRLVEGHFESGETALVIDDVLITGTSVLEGIHKLESSGLLLTDLVVLIDHEGGVRAKMHERGYQAHFVFTLSEISQTLYQT